MYWNRTTKKFIEVEEAKKEPQSNIRKFIHAGFFNNSNSDYIIHAQYTSKKTSIFQTEESEVKFTNNLNFYSDNKFINDIKVFEGKFSKFFEFNHDLNFFLEFLKRDALSEEISNSVVIENAYADLSRSILKSIEAGVFEYVEVGKENSKIGCEELYIDGLDYLNQATEFRAEIIQLIKEIKSNDNGPNKDL